jgi:hypothetical protein
MWSAMVVGLPVAARAHVHGDQLAFEEDLHGAAGEPHLDLAAREDRCGLQPSSSLALLGSAINTEGIPWPSRRIAQRLANR